MGEAVRPVRVEGHAGRVAGGQTGPGHRHAVTNHLPSEIKYYKNDAEAWHETKFQLRDNVVELQGQEQILKTRSRCLNGVATTNIVLMQ